MKNIIASVLMLCVTCTLYAQKPQKIEGIAKETKSIAYYKEQSQLWQQLIAKDSKNTDAWVNYYRAERARLQLEDPFLWANKKQDFYKRLSFILDKAQKHIDNTFEYYHLRGMNAQGENSIQAFKKAYNIDQDRNDIYGFLLCYYVPLFDSIHSEELAKKMLLQNIYSDASLKWNYNALQSVERDGIIITNGDMDCVPKWVLQYGSNIRQDVLVISKGLLIYNDLYREKVLQKINIRIDKKIKDLKTPEAYGDYLAAEILKKSTRPAYTSSGTPIQFFKDHAIENKMYLVGNALKYSTQNFNNTAVIKKNIEQRYYLEYLFKNFQYHQQDELVKTQMNLTYLPALVHLRDHYKNQKNLDKFDYYNSLINKIAEDSGRKEEVLNWF